tara:strand:+ start:321 stop:644 length:324 start_codon:yes stop_codon:yes gene_type:complete
MKLFKKLFSLILLFCFITAIFHSHPHFIHDHEKNSKQIIDHQNNSGQYFSNECEKCLIKNNKSELLYTAVDVFNFFPTLYKNKSQSFYKSCSTFFNLYSRPPPSSLS